MKRMINKTKHKVIVGMVIMTSVSLMGCGQSITAPSVDMPVIQEAMTQQTIVGQTSEEETTEQIPEVQTSTSEQPNEQIQNITEDNEAKVTASLKIDDYNTAEEIFENNNIIGNIADVGDNEFTMNPQITESKEVEGQLVEVDLTLLNKNSAIHIAYDEHTEFKLMTMNGETMVSLETANASALTEGAQIVIYGTEKDTDHWNADGIVVVLWK